MLGFAPGFGYLGPLPAPLRLPRRAEPRLRVPAGSVAIAGAQTAVYPHVTAGGWHLIGRTELPLWDPAASEPARLRPGDHVRFVPA
jgi:KipI family sensor histidine kinase inhibitor